MEKQFKIIVEKNKANDKIKQLLSEGNSIIRVIDIGPNLNSIEEVIIEYNQPKENEFKGLELIEE